MAFCPYFSRTCPQSDECEMWDTALSMCGKKRERSLLELINMKGEDAVASAPPVGKYKVTNIYIENGKLTVEYDDTPVE